MLGTIRGASAVRLEPSQKLHIALHIKVCIRHPHVQPYITEGPTCSAQVPANQESHFTATNTYEYELPVVGEWARGLRGAGLVLQTYVY